MGELRDFGSTNWSDDGTRKDMELHIRPTNFQMHFRKNPICYTAYSHDAFVEMEIQIMVDVMGMQKLLSNYSYKGSFKGSYFSDQLNKFYEEKTKQKEMAKSGKILCIGCKNGFQYWEIMQHVNEKCKDKWYAHFSGYLKSSRKRIFSMNYIELWNTVVLTRNRKAHYVGSSNLISTLDDFYSDLYEDLDHTDKAWELLASHLEGYGDGPEWPDELKF